MLNRKDRELAGVTADLLDHAFAWVHSRHGHQYWLDVCRNLRAIQDGTDNGPEVEASTTHETNGDRGE